MTKIKENFNIIVYFLVVCILTGIMFYAIDKKEGFHEDEIFSYGVANSSLSPTFLSYRRTDNFDTIRKTDNIFESIKNWIYYENYEEAENELMENTKTAIWRTRLDGQEYLRIDSVKEAFDFFSVIWNTARDVHPPLFYIAVHIVSIFFFGTFSKYIIFIVNLIFFIGTCILLWKILNKLNKKYLSVPNLIFYGASIGTISTVMFQRMYMMLTFFTMYFLLINLKIYYDGFKLSKKRKIELGIVTILGFLTQYYFCFYAAFLALVMIILMLNKKEKQLAKTYIFQYIRAGIIGVLIFFPSIIHIFFSYRGVGGVGSEYGIINKIIVFTESIFSAFSIPNIIGLIMLVVLLVALIVKFIKSDKKSIYLILTIPTFLYFIFAVIMSPYRSLRYVMNILPIITITVMILIDDFIKNKKALTISLSIFAVFLSTYGLLTNPIKYLYIGYNDYLKIAEEYKDDKFLLVCTTEFNQNQDGMEYGIYKESMIIAPKDLDYLKEVPEFKEEDEFILSIKNWLDKNPSEILKIVLKNTGFTDYELLYTSDKSAKCTVYKITK